MSTTTSSSTSPPASSTSSLVLACFAADSLALGCHWVYDPTVIRSNLGTVDRLLPPSLTTYHPDKHAGDLTHFGDVALVLLSHLSAHSPPAWDQTLYTRHWQQLWSSGAVHAWKDQATRHTLDNLKAGSPPGSAGSVKDDDIGHAARLFALLPLQLEEGELAAAARELVQVTQTDARCQATAEFFARVVHRLMRGGGEGGGGTPTSVMLQVVGEMRDEWLTGKVREGVSSAGQGDWVAMRRFGTACYVDSSLPGVVHFIAKYEAADDPVVALVEDNMVGGNNAARNILIAAVLYAYRGTAFPSLQRLVGGLRQREKIEQLVHDIEAKQQ